MLKPIKTTLTILCALLIFSCASFSVSAQAEIVLIKNESSPITVDGNIGEASWDSAFWESGMTDTGGLLEYSFLRLCWDNNYLYIAATIGHNTSLNQLSGTDGFYAELTFASEWTRSFGITCFNQPLYDGTDLRIKKAVRADVLNYFYDVELAYPFTSKIADGTAIQVRLLAKVTDQEGNVHTVPLGDYQTSLYHSEASMQAYLAAKTASAKAEASSKAATSAKSASSKSESGYSAASRDAASKAAASSKRAASASAGKSSGTKYAGAASHNTSDTSETTSQPEEAMQTTGVAESQAAAPVPEAMAQGAAKSPSRSFVAIIGIAAAAALLTPAILLIIKRPKAKPPHLPDEDTENPAAPAS